MFDSNNFTVFNVLFPKCMSLKRKAVYTVQFKSNARAKSDIRSNCCAARTCKPLQEAKVAQLFYCQNKFSRVCGDLAKWPDDRLWNSFKQLLKEAKQTKTVRNDRNHQKRIETMQTKKSPNDNVNDSNAERNASLDLDPTCWIILSAKFWMKELYLWQ